MLFSSTDFLFLFLPVVLAGYFALARIGDLRFTVGWLVLASFFFYAWWDPRLLPLLIGSILVNYSCGRELRRRPVKSLLAMG